ncbi:MAG: hypothetical protein J0I41_23505 [Filimonas sp.]|nr:hypothetical protein [Filimonas sp.]
MLKTKHKSIDDLLIVANLNFLNRKNGKDDFITSYAITIGEDKRYGSPLKITPFDEYIYPMVTYWKGNHQVIIPYAEARVKFGLVHEASPVITASKKGLYPLTKKAAQNIEETNSLKGRCIDDGRQVIETDAVSWKIFVEDYPEVYKLNDFSRYELNDWVVIATLVAIDNSVSFMSYDEIMERLVP